MSWNYRVVRYRNGEGFGLHEVYYDDSGQPNAHLYKISPETDYRNGALYISRQIASEIREAKGGEDE